MGFQWKLFRNKLLIENTLFKIFTSAKLSRSSPRLQLIAIILSQQILLKLFLAASSFEEKAAARNERSPEHPKNAIGSICDALASGCLIEFLWSLMEIRDFWNHFLIWSSFQKALLSKSFEYGSVWTLQTLPVRSTTFKLKSALRTVSDLKTLSDV